MKLAARTNERVLSTDGEVTPDAKITPLNESSSADNAAAAPPESQQARAPEPQPAPAPRAEPFPQGNAAQGGAGRSNTEAAPAPQVTRTEPLPQTASPLALSALIGVLSLAGAAGTRFLR